MRGYCPGSRNHTANPLFETVSDTQIQHCLSTLHSYCLGRTAVREDKELEPVRNGEAGLGTDAVERLLEPLGPLGAREGGVHHGGAPAAEVHVFQGLELLGGHEGALEGQAVALLLCGLRHVALGPDEALGGRYHGLADGVDGRVRHLPRLCHAMGGASPECMALGSDSRRDDS